MPFATQHAMLPDGLAHCPHLFAALPQGISTPEGCFAEFDGDGARPHITYDYITMSDAALSLVNGTNTVEACQAACAADQDCQYFAFDSEQRRCQLRNKVPYSKVDVNDASKSYAVFEVGAAGAGWRGFASLSSGSPLVYLWAGRGR